MSVSTATPIIMYIIHPIYTRYHMIWYHTREGMTSTSDCQIVRLDIIRWTRWILGYMYITYWWYTGIIQIRPTTHKSRRFNLKGESIELWDNDTHFLLSYFEQVSQVLNWAQLSTRGGHKEGEGTRSNCLLCRPWHLPWAISHPHSSIPEQAWQVWTLYFHVHVSSTSISIISKI